MLEALTLNNTQKLLKQSPYFAGMPKFTQLHIALGSSSNPFWFGYSTNEAIYNDTLDCFHFLGADTGTPLYRLNLNNFGSATAVMANDSSLIFSRLAVEPGNTGRLWGYVRQNSANDGLWRRDPSYGTPNWTKVVGAAANDAQELYQKVNGDLWYNNSTAGNWYLLQNGSVAATQTSAPPNLYQDNRSNSGWNTDFINTYDVSVITVSNMSPLTGQSNPPDATVATSYYINSLALHDNSASPSAATYRAQVPYEMILAARFANQIDKGDNCLRLIRLSSTYSLLALSMRPSVNSYDDPAGASVYARFGTGEWARQKISLALLNKTTNVIKYIGVVSVPTNSEGFTAASAEIQGYPLLALSARLKNSAIDLLIAGEVARNTSANRYSGLLWCAVPLLKLDF